MAEVLGCTDSPAAWVAWAARISHRSEGTSEDDVRLLEKLREWGHLSPFEFALWTVEVEVCPATRPLFEDFVFHAHGLVCSRGREENRYVITGNFRHLMEHRGFWPTAIREALDSYTAPWNGGVYGWFRDWLLGEAPLPGAGAKVETPSLYAPDVEGRLADPTERERHTFLTWLFENVSRAFSHQLVRHRIASYMQESLRYVEARGYIVPESFESLYPLAEGAMVEAFDTYDELVRVGVPKEDARFVLPIGTKTRIAVCASLEQWKHMIEVRTSPAAQWEIREKIEWVRDVLLERVSWFKEVLKQC